MEVLWYFFEQVKVTRDRYRLLLLLANQVIVLGHYVASRRPVLPPGGVPTQARSNRRYLTTCGSLACSGVPTPCERSLPSARARNSFSRRRCCSRDSGERHMPARRWCSAAIARYCVASTMISSHARSIRPAGAGTKGAGRLNGSHQSFEWKARTLCRRFDHYLVCAFAETESRGRSRRGLAEG